ncbi:BamA/TamA family outer membrane protein [Pukyongiella litopenaei]|nr:BamA/TamA family outer membrane protein [Pukyongiella litopenaei]
MLLAPLPVSAGSGIVDGQAATMEHAAGTPEYGVRDGSLVVAPIPFSNPTIGSGLVLGAGYLFNLDPASKPSMVGIGGLWSDNGSRGYGVNISLAFANNRWQVHGFHGKAGLNYDLYTPLGILPIRQDGRLSKLGLSYGVNHDLSFGLTLRHLDTSIEQKLIPLPPPFDRDIDLELLNIGAVVDWDTRDDTIYPRSGHRLYAEASHGEPLHQTRGRDYRKGYVNFDLFRPVGDHGVFAARFSACAADDEAPFFDKCALGLNDGFRGFSVTQFLDNRSASLQVAYRHRFGDRLGAVAFAGTGDVGPHYETFGEGGLHSAGGVGLRYRVSRKFPVDFAVDGSRNNLGENTLYIYVGQRF